MKIIKSSGNVFADLRLPGAEERLLLRTSGGDRDPWDAPVLVSGGFE